LLEVENPANLTRAFTDSFFKCKVLKTYTQFSCTELSMHQTYTQPLRMTNRTPGSVEPTGATRGDLA